MLKKLFSIEYGQWEKALSSETGDFVDGIFRQFTNCDPFETQGVFAPTNAYNELGSGVISPSKTIRKILPVYTAEANQFYCLADDYKMYRIDSLPPVVDVSSQIGSGTAVAIDMVKWKGGLAYAMSSEVRFNAIPVASGSDVQILSANPTSNLCIAADRNLYVGIGNNVGKITNSAGTTSNTSSVAASLESGNITKKLIADGRYLLWIADNSDSSGKNLITLAWWNLASSSFDDIQEFEGGSFRGAERVGRVIRLITENGLWEAVLGGGKPDCIVPFGGTIATSDIPVASFFHGSTGVHKESRMFWGTYQSGGNIICYGNKKSNKPPRLFQMGTSPDTAISAIASNNSIFIFATSGNISGGTRKLYSLRGSATANTAVANVAGFSLKKPYTFHHARVVLRSPISSGNSVSLQILTSNSTKTVLASTTKTNSTDSGERNLIFKNFAAGDGSDVRVFEDLSDVKLSTNVAVHSLEVWGEEVNSQSSYV